MNGIRPARNRLRQRDPTKPQEFWETDQWRNYFTEPDFEQERPPVPTPTWEAPDIDVAKLTEQAIGPMRREYEKGLEGIASRLSKRRMGESGAYGVAETESLKDFLAQVGAVSSDIALRGGELELKAAQLGMTNEQFYAQMQENRYMFDREYTLKETEAMERMKQEWMRLGLTEQEMKNEMYRFDQQMGWEKERFGLTLEWEQRRFADELFFRFEELRLNNELSWAQHNELVRQFDEALALERELENRRLDQDLTFEEWKHEIEQERNRMMQNEIFGYWDEGYPYQCKAYANRQQCEDEHYHRGVLDLREYEIYINGLLGLQGVTNADTGDTTRGMTQQEVDQWYQDNWIAHERGGWQSPEEADWYQPYPPRPQYQEESETRGKSRE